MLEHSSRRPIRGGNRLYLPGLSPAWAPCASSVLVSLWQGKKARALCRIYQRADEEPRTASSVSTSFIYSYDLTLYHRIYQVGIKGSFTGKRYCSPRSKSARDAYN